MSLFGFRIERPLEVIGFDRLAVRIILFYVLHSGITMAICVCGCVGDGLDIPQGGILLLNFTISAPSH